MKSKVQTCNSRTKAQNELKVWRKMKNIKTGRAIGKYVAEKRLGTKDTWDIFWIH